MSWVRDMKCPACGAENPAEQKFCNECAAPFKRRCAKCGYENAPAAKFCGECAAALTSPAPATRSPVSLASPAPATQSPGASRESALGGIDATERVRVQATDDAHAEGERKTVTALFADIKGSMDLMEDLDPEEARAIIDPALKVMIDAAHRYDGYIVQSTGDGIFALFGAPVAHEDHPQRALYAALRMQEDMRRYSAKLLETARPPIEARVGVNTGEVVVRSIRTDEAHTEYTPIGHSTSLAARLQTLAPTGSIAVAGPTRKLCEGYFTFKAMGAARLKGVSEPVEVYEVTGLGPLRTRLQRSASRGLTKFVGRDREMLAMKHAAEQALAGHGQIVAAMAEAGTGKSRLFFEFKAVAQSGWMVLETFSVSHGKASAFLALIDLLRNYFKISAEDDERQRREKVAGKVVILDRALEDTLPRLYSLLGIAEPDAPLAQTDAQVERRRTLEAVKRLLLRESLNQPLMLIFEDLHWVDDETQALLSLLADSIGTAQILLLVNYRPEYTHQWGSKTYYTQLRLDPLGRESAGEMLSALLSETLPSPGAAMPRRPLPGQGEAHFRIPLPDQGEGGEREGARQVRVSEGGIADLKRLIIDKTEGNPFFIEEIVQALFEEGALARNGAVRLTRPLGELKLPPTVQGILASRIDRLSAETKELLQTLAVIGKELPLDLVKQVAKHSDDAIERMLSSLQLGEFIYEQPAVGEVEYTFKHALTQEVAYNSMLAERRKQLHRRAGQAIEDLHANRLEDQYEQLARHYDRAGDNPKAVHYLQLAGRQAYERLAYQEANAHVARGLELLAALPEGRARDQQEIRLRLVLGRVLTAIKGPTNEEIGAALRRAHELCRLTGDTSELREVLGGLSLFHRLKGELQRARELTEEALATSQPASISQHAQELFSLGQSLGYTDELTRSREVFEQAIALFESQPKSSGLRLRDACTRARHGKPGVLAARVSRTGAQEKSRGAGPGPKESRSDPVGPCAGVWQRGPLPLRPARDTAPAR